MSIGKHEFCRSAKHRCCLTPAASMPLLKWSFLNRFFASLLQIGEADNKELRGFLRYVVTGEVSTEYTRRIDDMVRTIKVSEQMRKEYRILPAVIMDAIDEGVERGKSLGLAEGMAEVEAIQ